MANDVELGRNVHAYLQSIGLETPMVDYTPHDHNVRGCKDAANYNMIRNAQMNIMETLRLDMTDDSLRDTPNRIAKMYCQEIFTGLDYANFPKCTTVANKWTDEMVAVANIEVCSMCEHHFLPFIGTAAVAYIPKDDVLGLSKFNRVVDFFARRPQIQERLTEQVAAALRYILKTDDVAVVIKAKHYCVQLRGVKDANSETITSRMSGKFLAVPALRAEFLSLVK